MILDIDAGNTRLKYRVIEGSGNIIGSETKELIYPASMTELLESLSGEVPKSELTRVRIASVRDTAFNNTFFDIVQSQWQIAPEFAEVEKNSCGVTNAYSDIQTMGVDRWLAMIAAFNHVRSVCCVLDFGSAITFDWIDSHGFHQGGYIVPGISLMQESLARKTSALDITLEQWEQVGPGKSTAETISHGILAMVTGFVGFCREQAEKSGSECHWFLAGGDAELVSHQLDWKHEIRKDLVLEGLDLILP